VHAAGENDSTMIRLPPTASLRAFEVAARSGSFVRAAAALHLTPSAVSHQIDALERTLGVVLFESVGRGKRLTAAGRRLAAGVTSGLDAIAAAIASLSDESTTELRVSVLPSLATRWLMARLPHFVESHRQISIRLEVSQSFTRFREDGTHLALRYGAGRWAGLRARHLGHESLLPVCAPALLAPKASRRRTQPTAAWPDAPLIEDLHHPWERWVSLSGEPDAGLARRRIALACDDSALALDAAEAGIGIALARRRLAADALQAKRLVALASAEVRAEYAYYAVGPSAVFALPAVSALLDWLEHEFAHEHGVERSRKTDGR
jgi:LysR family glycine cleavage system transcriptional activator